MTTSFPVHTGVTTPNINWKSSDARLARIAQIAPRKPWEQFVKHDFKPEPGEHVGIIGPTGQGKTVLQNNILPFFPFVAVFATKPADDSMETLIESRNYVRLAKWVRLNPIDVPRRVIWPDARRIDAVGKQREVFADAFDKAFREGGRPKNKPVGWAIAIDELWYMTNVLKLDLQVKMVLLQGRSIGVSLIAATQRPKHIPLEVYDQSTHLFFFRDNDENNLERIAGINVREKRLMRDIVANLDAHQVLYVNTRTGKMIRTRTPPPIGR